jgi:hypothetical protein
MEDLICLAEEAPDDRRAEIEYLIDRFDALQKRMLNKWAPPAAERSFAARCSCGRFAPPFRSFNEASPVAKSGHRWITN